MVALVLILCVVFSIVFYMQQVHSESIRKLAQGARLEIERLDKRVDAVADKTENIALVATHAYNKSHRK
jgi:hypothetical protein